jgi:hypothetical protein
MATDFDPRRAEPGQEFGYTASETADLPEGENLTDEQVAEGWTITGFDPDTKKREITRAGVQKTFKADANGVVHPKSLDEERVADAYGLPVARKAAEKTPEASGKKES